MNNPTSLSFSTCSIFALALGVTGCEEEVEALNKTNVVKATVEQVILTDLEVLERTADELYSSSVSFCEAPSLSKLQRIQYAWKGGKTMLKSVEVLKFGPYDFLEIDVSKNLDNWPERGVGIESILMGSETIDELFLSSLNRPDVSSGYPALGYLLHSSASQEEVLASFQEPRRCSYLVSQSALNLSIIQDFRDAWVPEGRDYAADLINAGQGNSSFVSPEEVIGMLLQSMNRLVQHMSSIKLAQPLDLSRSDSVEAFYSQNSLQDLETNLNAIENLYKGANPSISDYIVSREGEEVDAMIRENISSVRDAIQNITRPLSDSIVEEPQNVAALIVALEVLSDTFSHDAERYLMLPR